MAKVLSLWSVKPSTYCELGTGDPIAEQNLGASSNFLLWNGINNVPWSKRRNYAKLCIFKEMSLKNSYFEKSFTKQSV